VSRWLLLALMACSTAPESDVWLPSNFQSFQDGVGAAEAEEITTQRMVLRYVDGDSEAQWATWSALLEREGYTWDHSPTSAMGMTFDTFTNANGDARKLIVARRAGAVFVQMDIETGG